METDLILNHSSTYSVGLLNFPDVSTESVAVEQAIKWTSVEIVRLLQIF